MSDDLMNLMPENMGGELNRRVCGKKCEELNRKIGVWEKKRVQ